MEKVTVTEAARRFFELLNRVRYQGRSFEVARGSEVVARLVPAHPPAVVQVADLDRILSALAPLDDEDGVQFEHDVRSLRHSLWCTGFEVGLARKSHRSDPEFGKTQFE